VNNKKIIFGYWEGSSLLITMLATKAVLGFPRIAAQTAGPAAWMMSIYISLLALGVFYIFQRMYKPFNGKDILDIGQFAAGNAGRVLTGVIIICYLLYSVSSMLRQWGEQMKIMGFRDSPVSFIMLFYIVAMVIAAYLGLESITRFLAIFVPITIVNFMIYIVILWPDYNVNNFFPILGTGIYDILVKGFFRVSAYSEILYLFLLVPFLTTYKNFKRAGFTSIALTAFFLTAITMSFTAIFPYPVSLESINPAYQMGRIFKFGRFLERVEPLFLITWAAMGFTFLSVGLFFLAHVFKKTFKLDYYRPVILPFAIIIFTLAILPPSHISLNYLMISLIDKYLWIVTLGLLAIVISYAYFRRNKRIKSKKSSA